MFISEIVHTEGSFLLKLYYKFNFATEPFIIYSIAVKEKVMIIKAKKKTVRNPIKLSILFHPPI
ncbi:hypothetical protein B4U56_00355 [Staphylococcus epidermidis]|nr:hypothetical protein B4U56_00355 [Staphylococcus epidermidis]